MMAMGMGMGGAAPMPADPSMGGMPPAMAPMDPTEMMLQQLQALFAKWGSGEMQIAGEKGALSSTLMQLLQVAPPSPAQAFAEPGMGSSMVGPPQDDMAPAAPF